MVGSKIKEIINTRVVFIMCHGASIQELEARIEEFQSYDICYMSLGLFTVMEDFILSKINRRLDLIFDCATLPDPQKDFYERQIRLPRIEKFLARPDNNLWITTHGLLRDAITPYGPHIYANYEHKIVRVDSLFPQNKIPFYMDVPNSITLMIATALYGGARKIILFGYDGHRGDEASSYSTYYKPELANLEWLQAYGPGINYGLKRDTLDFDRRFQSILSLYRQLFGNMADIVNCSPNSSYNCIRKITYNHLKEEL